jgi:hypothetical protein
MKQPLHSGFASSALCGVMRAAMRIQIAALMTEACNGQV